jgi:hypothetical protein
MENKNTLKFTLGDSFELYETKDIEKIRKKLIFNPKFSNILNLFETDSNRQKGKGEITPPINIT